MLPAATGEMTARQDRTLAPFHGVKLATTPSGRRIPIEWVPCRVRLQHLALREVHPTRRLLDGGRDEVLLEGGEGDRAPVSRARISAISARRRLTISAALKNSRALSAGVVSDQAGNALAAASTATRLPPGACR